MGSSTELSKAQCVALLKNMMMIEYEAAMRQWRKDINRELFDIRLKQKALSMEVKRGKAAV